MNMIGAGAYTNRGGACQDWKVCIEVLLEANLGEFGAGFQIQKIPEVPLTWSGRIEENPVIKLRHIELH